jgi:hypothetical protein
MNFVAYATKFIPENLFTKSHLPGFKELSGSGCTHLYAKLRSLKHLLYPLTSFAFQLRSSGSEGNL